MMIRLGLALATVFVTTHAFAGVIDSPKRYALPKFAEKKGLPEEVIARRYAATVVIRCNGHQATGQFRAL
ncbi:MULTISPECIES: hypothetical protein [unclassified Bradyrhizobium]